MQAAIRYGRPENPSTRSSRSLRPWVRTKRPDCVPARCRWKRASGVSPVTPTYTHPFAAPPGLRSRNARFFQTPDRVRSHRRCGAPATTSAATGPRTAKRTPPRLRAPDWARSARPPRCAASHPTERTRRTTSSARGSRSRAPTADSPRAERRRLGPSHRILQSKRHHGEPHPADHNGDPDPQDARREYESAGESEDDDKAAEQREPCKQRCAPATHRPRGSEATHRKAHETERTRGEMRQSSVGPIDVGNPSGVPGGNPTTGSAVNMAPAIIERPSRVRSHVTVRAFGPNARANPAVAARTIRPVSANRFRTHPPGPFASTLSGCREKSKPSRRRACARPTVR